MSRLITITEPTTDEQKHLLQSTERQLGRTPNLYRTMANSPAALQGYLNFRTALVSGRFDATLREKLAIAIAEANDCHYCVSAHHLRGSKIGLAAEELALNRQGSSADAKDAAAVRLAQQMVVQTGRVSDEDLGEARQAGLNDADIAEIAAHVALNTFSNWFSHIAEPELDFPAAP
jgi:uncharacterized peroxidase-related enzyme